MAERINTYQVEVTKVEDELKITVKDQILFPEGSWQLSRKAKDALNKMVPTLQTLTQTKIVVDGYTDNEPVGSELGPLGIASNLELSSKRADTVVRHLKSQGVNRDRMSAQGFGAAYAVASNDTPEGRAKNRRVEITLLTDRT
jgi:chemotaxis protein MotB